MNERKMITFWICIVILFIPLVIGMNYFVDPYGIRDTKSAFVKNVTKNKHIRILNKLMVKSDYYLLGTSRLLRVDPLDVERVLGKSVHNINIEGSSFYENLYLAEDVKKINKNLIYGFDAFSLNSNRKQTKRLNELVSIKENYILENTLQYLSSEMLNDSVVHVLYKLLKKDRDYYFQKEDSLDLSKPTLSMIKEKAKLYPDFQIVPNKEINKLATILDKDDIVVIYPKYYEYYKFFQKHQSVEVKYFKAIKHLVKSTSAKVYMFYGINEITTNHNNFDKGGWHFKPKVAKEIFGCMLNNKCKNNSEVLLTADNVEGNLQELSDEIKKYDKYNVLLYQDHLTQHSYSSNLRYF
jgi:hypothetical protein